MSTLAYGIDRLEAVFDEGSLIADGGLLSTGSVMDRLGSEALIDEAVRPAQAGRGSGHKVLSLVSSMLLGGCCIDDADRLRAGSAQAVLPFVVAAPSTLGSFLRSFRLGHVRQFDKAQEQALARAWSLGAAPLPAGGLTVDLDSTVCQVCGRLSRERRMAIARCCAITLWSRRAQTAARSCIGGCARVLLSAAVSGSRQRRWAGSDALRNAGT